MLQQIIDILRRFFDIMSLQYIYVVSPFMFILVSTVLLSTIFDLIQFTECKKKNAHNTKIVFGHSGFYNGKITLKNQLLKHKNKGRYAYD